jgi:hypothetical protein
MGMPLFSNNSLIIKQRFSTLKKERLSKALEAKQTLSN